MKRLKETVKKVFHEVKLPDSLEYTPYEVHHMLSIDPNGLKKIVFEVKKGETYIRREYDYEDLMKWLENRTYVAMYDYNVDVRSYVDTHNTLVFSIGFTMGLHSVSDGKKMLALEGISVVGNGARDATLRITGEYHV